MLDPTFTIIMHGPRWATGGNSTTHGSARCKAPLGPPIYTSGMAKATEYQLASGQGQHPPTIIIRESSSDWLETRRRPSCSISLEQFTNSILLTSFRPL